jgi:aryl-alcohol dehydrogenase-like predicted oxidoreductase
MLSKLIIGTVQFGLNYGITNTNGKTSKEDLDNIFNFCNQSNIKFFDTAQDYGNSEDILKEYKNKYSDIIIITKSKFKNKDINETINLSINKFNKIDYFLLHSFDDYTEQVIDKLIEYKKENKITKIGVSIYNINEAKQLLIDNKIDIIQLPFNYLDKQWFDKEFQDLIKKNKVEIHVRSIFLQGILLNPILDSKKPINISKEDFNYLNNIIDEISNEFKLSRLELCFAYINSFEWIDKFLIGIDNYNHLLLNYEIIKKDLRLNGQQIQFINDKIKDINILICCPLEWKFN